MKTGAVQCSMERASMLTRTSTHARSVKTAVLHGTFKASPGRRNLLKTSAAYQPVGNAVVGAPIQTVPEPSGPIPAVYNTIEKAIQNTFNNQKPGQRNDWKEIEGAWVLFPPHNRQPEVVVHFLGAAFVGAAPQMAYRLFLEALANRNILVIATPYHTSFDHLRVADEAQFRFDRAMRALAPNLPGTLPVYGVGHSLGAVIQLLISTRYTVGRSGNAFISFNNRHASEVIPFLSPLIAPSARLLGPVLNQIASSPVRSTVESVTETIRSMSPGMVRQVMPLVEQIAPMYLDLAQGREGQTPAPEETKNLVRSYYSVSRNLLLRFKDDGMDETNELAAVLQSTPNVSEVLDLAVRTLPGDHLRPMRQAFADLPPDVARLAGQAVYTGGDLIGRLAGVATQMGVSQVRQPLMDLGRGVQDMAGVFGGEVGGPMTDSMQGLADEVAAWIGTGAAVYSGNKALSAATVYNRSQQQYGANGEGPAAAAPNMAF